MNRIHNFCAGPCTLPVAVLEKVQAELLDYQGRGLSIMEMSHRSALFEALHGETLALAQSLLGAPKDFKALLLPGGAHQQFAMSAMNLLSEGGTAGFIDSGVWGKKAMDEAARIGDVACLWSGAALHYRRLPDAGDWLEPEALRYLHLTSNETVNGLQFRAFPPSRAKLVIDASSDYYSRPLPWERCHLVYGGVQKNLAPSGLALVFVQEALLQPRPSLPEFFSYEAHARANSLYNTPPTFQIYVLHEVLSWMQAQGDLAHWEKQSVEKSALLYDYLDGSAFYRNDIEPAYRSRMNVVFRTPRPEWDSEFYREAEAAGLSGLKGHRLLGGLRASLYHGLERRSVQALIEFMDDFAARRGEA